MLKAWNRLLWSGVKKIRKAQKSHNKKLVKSLFAAPASKASLPPRNPSTKRIAIGSAVQPAGKWLSACFSSLEVDRALPARRMRYWLYLPANAPRASLPLVVMLHGCEQTAAEFAQGTRMNLLAEQKGFAVLYPQQSLNAHPHRCWPWYKPAIQHGGGEAKMIAAMVEKVVLKNALDRSRVYLAGLSAGAAMANIVALNYPHLIAAVGMHSGTVFGAAHTSVGGYGVMQHGALQSIDAAIRDAVKKHRFFPSMPAILIHGSQDAVVRPVNLAQLTRQFKLLKQLSAESDEPVLRAKSNAETDSVRGKNYQTDMYYAGKTLVLKVCEIFSLEHAWSGGDCALRFNRCKGPDASKMMWNFFARHRREV